MMYALRITPVYLITLFIICFFFNLFIFIFFMIHFYNLNWTVCVIYALGKCPLAPALGDFCIWTIMYYLYIYTSNEDFYHFLFSVQSKILKLFL